MNGLVYLNGGVYTFFVNKTNKMICMKKQLISPVNTVLPNKIIPDIEILPSENKKVKL